MFLKGIYFMRLVALILISYVTFGTLVQETKEEMLKQNKNVNDIDIHIAVFMFVFFFFIIPFLEMQQSHLNAARRKKATHTDKEWNIQFETYELLFVLLVILGMVAYSLWFYEKKILISSSLYKDIWLWNCVNFIADYYIHKHHKKSLRPYYTEGY